MKDEEEEETPKVAENNIKARVGAKSFCSLNSEAGVERQELNVRIISVDISNLTHPIPQRDEASRMFAACEFKSMSKKTRDSAGLCVGRRFNSPFESISQRCK